VVESGEYEERGIDCVASSVEAAVAHLKKRYAAYKVTWSEPKLLAYATPVFYLTGSFEHIQGLSTKHDSDYTISEYQVE